MRRFHKALLAVGICTLLGLAACATGDVKDTGHRDAAKRFKAFADRWFPVQNFEPSEEDAELFRSHYGELFDLVEPDLEGRPNLKIVAAIVVFSMEDGTPTEPLRLQDVLLTRTGAPAAWAAWIMDGTSTSLHPQARALMVCRQAVACRAPRADSITIDGLLQWDGLGGGRGEPLWEWTAEEAQAAPDLWLSMSMRERWEKLSAVWQLDDSFGGTCEPVPDRKPLHQAAIEGRAADVRALLANSRSVDPKDGDARTPLLLAGWWGRVECARVLLEHGADVNRKDSEGWTALHWAAAAGETATARVLLNAGADLDVPDDHGRTPLYVAAMGGERTVVDLLLKAGANADAQDECEETPLFPAARFERLSVVRSLSEAGADPNVTNWRGETALHVALEQYLTARAVPVLMANPRVDVSIRTPQGATPLHQACGKPLREVSCIKALLAKGADPNARGKEKKTPLHMVCANESWKSDSEKVRALLDHGADPNIRDGQGRTPLHYACANRSGTVESVEALLVKGAEPNARDNTGITPLQMVYRARRAGVTKVFLAHGVDVNALDDQGKTPRGRTPLDDSPLSMERSL